MVFFELESIKMVNEAIQNPSRALSDAVIASVGCLVHSGWDELMWDENLRSPFSITLDRLAVSGYLWKYIDEFRSLIKRPCPADQAERRTRTD
jgi:hypothetical protein